MSRRRRYYTVTNVFKKPIWDVLLSYSLGVILLTFLVLSYKQQIAEDGEVSNVTRIGVAIGAVYCIYATSKIVYGLCSKRTRRMLFKEDAE